MSLGNVLKASEEFFKKTRAGFKVFTVQFSTQQSKNAKHTGRFQGSM